MSSDLTGFSEHLLRLLDTSRKTSTYKYALLLALMDVIASHTDADGHAPTSVTATDLAPRVIDLYWQQTLGWPDSGDPLRQNSGGQADIVRRIAEFRAKTVGDAAAPFAQAHQLAQEAGEKLIGEVRWKLIEMPIPKLQRADGLDDPFIYEIGWDDGVTRRVAESVDFDDSLSFVGQAGEHLLSMAALFRPLVQRSWALDVARLNKLKEDQLEQYLFDPRRLGLSRIHRALRELEGGRCFYCRKPVISGAQIDHFIPWSRHFDNSIQNLVYAHGTCNNSKRAHLASPKHLKRWLKRAKKKQLAQIATEKHWESRPNETIAIARGSYLKLSEGALLWAGRGNPPKMEAAKPADLLELFA